MSATSKQSKVKFESTLYQSIGARSIYERFCIFFFYSVFGPFLGLLVGLPILELITRIDKLDQSIFYDVIRAPFFYISISYLIGGPAAVVTGILVALSKRPNEDRAYHQASACALFGTSPIMLFWMLIASEGGKRHEPTLLIIGALILVCGVIASCIIRFFIDLLPDKRPNLPKQ